MLILTGHGRQLLLPPFSRVPHNGAAGVPPGEIETALIEGNGQTPERPIPWRAFGGPGGEGRGAAQAPA
jgi:hypothetical protein